MNATPSHRTVIEPLEARQLLAADSGITARLEAPTINRWISTYVFKVVYNGGHVAIDPRTIDDNDLVVAGPNGFSRRARLHRVATASNPAVQTVWYKISAPNGVWDAADNGTYSVRLNNAQVANVAGATATGRVFGSFSVKVAQYPTTTTATMTSGVGGGPASGSVNGVDARNFGAIPNDGIDDTLAIQRAIDSLRRDGDGVPDGANPIGGVVELSAGVYNTNGPLRLPTAAILRGRGSSTVISNSSSDGSRGAVEFYSYSTHGYNILAGVEDLSIVTGAAKGIRAEPLAGDLIGLRLKNLKISAGGAAIDLREVRTYNADIRNITVQNPGSTALWIGAARDWVGAVNRLSNFNVTGTARAGFRAEQGMLVLGGDVNVDGLRIAKTGAPVTPLYVRGSLSMRGLNLAAGITPPGNVAARFDTCFSVDIDRIDGLNSARRLQLINTRDVRIATLGLTGGRIADALSVDSSSHVTVQTLRTPSAPGSTAEPGWLVSTVAAPDAGGTWSPGDPVVGGPTSGVAVNVQAFGAFPDDNADDTDAIQRAIDSLPHASGVVGGSVFFPAGRFNTSRPIRLPSGVWLRGQGNATSIYSSLGDPSRGAVEFIAAAGQAYNVGAGVEDLGIYTTTGAAIRADASITSGLIDPYISDLEISADGLAIDLGAVRTYHARIEDIVVSNPGGSALVLGDAAGYSADNRVIGLQLQGTVRSDFVPDRALIVLRGDYVFENGWIEQPNGARALPLYLSGSATIRGLWLEFPATNLPDGNQIVFQNVSRASVDRLYHVMPISRIKLINAQNVSVNFFNIDGMTTTLRETITVDEKSRLSLGLVNAQQDSGLLDHPRVKVLATYNEHDGLWLKNRTPSPATNLLLDPLFTSLINAGSDKRDDAPSPGLDGAWRVVWGDALGAVVGTISVENTTSGPRLKIVVTSNPNGRAVAVIGKLTVPSSAIGRHGAARWRVDGSRQAFVYTRDYSVQYEARAMNGATSARTPLSLGTDDELIFLMPQAAGTYYISGVSIAAI